jgi:hypothetical protein
MPLIFRTAQDHPAVTISGVGRLPANGVGGLLVSDAAERMRELQDEAGEPLSGSALKAAGRRFAEGRPGIELGDVSDAKVEKLPELNGAPAQRPPLAEVAQASPRAKFASTSSEEPNTAVVDPTDPAADEPQA